ncbi:MAG: manganese efflux pump [Candidatus Eremiobacteraeota bacterium]|nr:manganese efflux pump [Candidatus Eremiobacteraeota bacterium]
MGAAILKVVVVALALALDVFAVSVGVGVRGVPSSQKLRIGITFAFAEIVMNLIGAGLGAVAGHLVGDYAGYIGFAALIGLGIYMMRESSTDLSSSQRLDLSSGRGLTIAAFAISLDSLGIGFSILYIGVPIAVSLTVIFATSIAFTTLGLTLGRWLGRYAARNAAFIGGLVLALTGVAFAVLKALRIG